MHIDGIYGHHMGKKCEYISFVSHFIEIKYCEIKLKYNMAACSTT